MERKVEFRLGELFCGPGGLAYGAKCANVISPFGSRFSIRHAWATDYDPSTCKTYAHNICGGDSSTVVCADIRKLKLEKLQLISDVDALAFGFPCNDFNMVGEQKIWREYD